MNGHADTRAMLGPGGDAEARPRWVRRLLDFWSRRRGRREVNPRGTAERRHSRILRRALRAGPVAGNHAEILIDGPQTHRAMFDAMALAQDHINIESYILEDAGPGTELRELLLMKRSEGVRINIIYDAFGSWTTPAQYFETLRAAGVQLLEFSPINPLRHPIRWSVHLRDHRKLLVVDGRVAFIGGVNISSVYSRPPASGDRQMPWRDTHLRIEGPVVGDLQRLYIEHWRSRADAPPQPAQYFPRLEVVGHQAVAVAACAAGRRRNPLYRALLGAIRAAQNHVYITSAYFVPTRRLVRALIDAARRGVDVRLALPGISDSWAPLAAGRSIYGRLLQAGVRIYERHNAILHAKTAVIDGAWVTVGSSNMDWRSLLHNAEANVVIIDAELAARFEALFAVDIAASEELTLERWMRRGWTARLVEWLAQRLEFLL
ncbi:MAG TPA: phospholipase D-like domain-containing protein [Burkholderiaceae bacterium]|nr:phospholipase D-like domain-containing protein [Burkholderiaceae bacterium]